MANFDLKTWRRVKNFTQKDVADIMKVSIKTVSNWELGTYAAPHDLEYRLGGALDPLKMTEEERDRLDPVVCFKHNGETNPEWFERVKGRGGHSEYIRTKQHPGYGTGGKIRQSEIPALLEKRKAELAQPAKPSLSAALEHGANTDDWSAANALMKPRA